MDIRGALSLLSPESSCPSVEVSFVENIRKYIFILIFEEIPNPHSCYKEAAIINSFTTCFSCIQETLKMLSG